MRDYAPAPPQDEAGDVTGPPEIGLVVFEIDCRGGRVVATPGANDRGIARRPFIFGQSLFLEKLLCAGKSDEGGMKEQDRVAVDKALRHVPRLRQKEPMVITPCQPCIHRAPDVQRRQNIDQGDGTHDARVVQNHPVRGAGAAIMRNNVEARVSHMAHQGDLIARHGPEGEIAVMSDGISVTTQIRRHDTIGFRKFLGDDMPHDMGLRISVQEKKRRAFAAHPRMDHCSWNVDVYLFKPCEQGNLRFGHLSHQLH